jgi:hypothetical protein
MRILMLAGVLFVIGCAPMKDTTQEYTWYKRFDPAMEDRQRDIDLAQCNSGASTDGAYAATGIDSGEADDAHVSLVDACMVRHGWAKVRSS